MSVTILVLSFFVGIVQSITPDRWLPGSIVAWKRGFSTLQTLGLSLLLAVAHIFMGYGLYLTLRTLGALELQQTLGFSLFATLLLFMGLTLRFLSFKRMKEIVFSSNKSAFPLGLLLQLIGPSEVLVLVLIRTSRYPTHVLEIVGAYAAGTVVAMSLLSVFGRELWNKPYRLPRGLQIATQSTAALSILTGIGLTILSAARFL